MTERGKLETILVATDFSPCAEGAIDWAVEVARTHGAKLLMMHALQAPLLVEADRNRCEEVLAERAEAIRSTGITVESKIFVGSGATASTIVEAAKAAGADLIVAGTNGQTGLLRVYLGGTASHVVRHASCPVMTIHPEHARQHRPIRHILVPTDYSADAALALCEAVRLLGPVSSSLQVVILHVYRLHPHVVYPWTPSAPAHRRSELAHETQRHLEKIAAPLRELGLDIQVVAQEGHPPEVIDAEANRVAADVIAMGTHGRSGLNRLLFGSVAERVLPRAPCPVFTVHTGTKS